MTITFQLQKKHIIYIFITTLLCVISFLIGRFCWPTSIIGKDLITGIESSENMTDEIYNDLLQAGCALESAKKYAGFVQELMLMHQDTTKIMEDQITAIKASTEQEGKALQKLLEIYKDNTCEDIIDAMIFKAKQYEKILEELVE